jgi:hypothetical protein
MPTTRPAFMNLTTPIITLEDQLITEIMFPIA